MTRRHWIALGLITVLGLVLFTWDLGSKSMWADEIGSVKIAAEETIPELWNAYRVSDARQPPLYLFILRAGILIGGENHIPVRLPAALFAAASVPLMAWVANRLAGPQVALISALLVATSPLVLLFGRMARPYAFALFLTLASTGFMIELLRRSKVSTPIAIYVTSSLLLILTNYVNGSTIVAQNLFFAVWYLKSQQEDEGARKSKLKTWILGQAVIWTLFAIWLTVDLGRTSAFAQLPRRQFDVQGVTEVFMKLTYPLYAFSLGETIFPWHPLAALSLVIFAVVTIVGLRHLSRVGEFKWLSPIVFLTTLFLTVFAYMTIVRTHSFETIPSRAIGALPFLLLILALGISRLKHAIGISILGLLMATYAVAATNYFRNTDFHNPIYVVPTQEIAAMVRSELRRGDLMIADEDMDFDYYFFMGGTPRNLLFAQQVDRVRNTLLKGSYHRVWLITLGRDGTLGVTPFELEDWVEENYELESSVGYVPQDPTYSRVKEAIQGFPDYSHKARVRLYNHK